MTPQPIPTQPANQASPSSEDTQHYLQICRTLVDMGTNLARKLHDQATAEATANNGEAVQSPAETPLAETPLTETPLTQTIETIEAFDRIARCIRRTIFLAQKLAEPRRTAAPHPGEQRTAARKRILREIEDTIETKAPRAEAESLRDELRERLDSPDLDDDITTRPVTEIINEIIRDLGLAPRYSAHPGKRRTPADVAVLTATAKKTSSRAEPWLAYQAPATPLQNPLQARKPPSG